MTPEQEQQFNQMKERLELLESASNNDANELYIENLVKRKTDVDDSLVTKTTFIGEGGGTVNAFDFPDQFIEIKYKGSLYRLPAYNAQRFV